MSSASLARQRPARETSCQRSRFEVSQRRSVRSDGVGVGWAGPSWWCASIRVSRPVMPLFKKKDPKEQVSRPLDDLEVETAVCDRTCLITSLTPAQRMEITVEKGAESDSETNQWQDAPSHTRNHPASHRVNLLGLTLRMSLSLLSALKRVIPHHMPLSRRPIAVSRGSPSPSLFPSLFLSLSHHPSVSFLLPPSPQGSSVRRPR